MKIKFYILLFAAVGPLMLGSCKRNSDNPLWNVDLLAPLVQSSLTISNLIKDTTNIKMNPDNSITIVSRQQLANINLDSLVTLNTTPYTKTVTLDSLVLETRSDTTRITLGTIADSLSASSDSDAQLLGWGIKYAALTNTPVDLTNLPVLAFHNIAIDANNFFQEANVKEGKLTVKIINTLPATVQTLAFSLKNKVNQNQIISHTFTNIPTGGFAETQEDLDGKQIEGAMTGDMSTLALEGPNNAIISLDQSLIVVMTISEVKVNSATAVFPAQDIVENEDESALTGLGDVELITADIDSGFIKVDISSTAQDKVYFTYEIPGAEDKNGNTFKVVSAVRSALPGQTVDTTIYYSLAGYKLDLTGKNHDKVNTFYSTLKGRIEYTGRLVHFSLSDYMTVNVSASSLKPFYVKGYLGQNTVNLGPAVTDIPIFRGVESGTMNFENINMKVVLDNGFGIDGAVQINSITASNSRTGASQTLTGPNVGTPVTITKATDNPYTSTSSTIDMGTSSNATNLINILPDKIGYNVQVKTNPGGNTHAYTDFAYKTGAIKASLDIEMPLSILSSQLVLGDTADFNTAALKKKNVNSGQFRVLVNNGFPLNAALKMYFLDMYGNMLDSVKSASGSILAAPVNGAFRVIEKRSSMIVFDANEAMMQNLYNSTKVIFKIEFTTEPASTFMKIYSDYSIDFKLVGDMNYSLYKK